MTGEHYTGQQRDRETAGMANSSGPLNSGNDYFGARYYSSGTGRFLRPDPSQLSYADPTNPQSFNLYAYALNNPLINIDPTGMTCQTNDDGTIYDDEDGKGCDLLDQQEAQNPYVYQFGYSFSDAADTTSSQSEGYIPLMSPSKLLCASLNPPSGPINYSASAAYNATKSILVFTKHSKEGERRTSRAIRILDHQQIKELLAISTSGLRWPRGELVFQQQSD